MYTRLVPLSLILGLFVGGCGDNSEWETKPRQGEALALVWNAQYGMTAAAPPVAWIEDDKLTCLDGMTCVDGQCFATELGCRAGISWEKVDVILVAWPTGARFHKTVLAHELCHRRMVIETGDGDGDHHGPCFTQGGYTDQANAALASLGM